MRDLPNAEVQAISGGFVEDMFLFGILAMPAMGLGLGLLAGAVESVTGIDTVSFLKSDIDVPRCNHCIPW